MMKYSVVQLESLVKFVWFCVTTKKCSISQGHLLVMTIKASSSQLTWESREKKEESRLAECRQFAEE